MIFPTFEQMRDEVHKTVEQCGEAGGLKVTDPAAWRGGLCDDVVETAVFSPDPEVRGRARFILKNVSRALGLYLASIQDLYAAVGRGEAGPFTVPAMNIRGLSYDTARAFYRAANKTGCGAYLFEIARSEMGYTDQRPHEYVAVMLAAAIREGFTGPVFIQGDHFQAAAKGYFENPDAEVDKLRTLIREALAAGFYNIDIDSSTLVVLERKGLSAQQRDNGDVAAALTRYIREHQPEGIMVSVGGEIGEVGGHNSTVAEFEAFMGEYHRALGEGAQGISKISVQTGTSHGGVVLPDGSVAKVKLDFEVLKAISDAARSKYGLGGTVQHGASTLPDELFHRFPECGAVEVHLATGFQNLVFDHPALPGAFRERVYAHLATACAKERKDGETDEQFYYKTRKRGFGGALKREWWSLPAGVREELGAALEEKFAFLIGQLGVAGSREVVGRFVKPSDPTPDRDAEIAACKTVVVEVPDHNPRAD
jgi:fructose/tagatose bisphosphate aldolase